MKPQKNQQEKKASQWGQTALELAVFGGILLFVIGVIIRSALNFSYGQHNQLRATRMAMQQSYMYSEGMFGSGPQASRNQASVLLLEDRLTSKPGKFATVDRTPYMSAGSALFTRHLFMPIEGDDPKDIPRIDIFVNGQYFSLTTSAYMTVPITQTEGSTHPDWDDTCLIRTTTSLSATGALIINTSDYGCMSYPARAFNYMVSEKYCCAGGCVNTCPAGGMSEDDRFDLDRDGVYDNVPAALRPDFAWQWYRVRAWQSGAAGVSANFPAYELMSVDDHENVMIDVDGDFKLEQVFRMDNRDAIGRPRSFWVEDYQEGDFDQTIGNHETKPKNEIGKDLQVLTYTDPGHYLLIEEGKLFTPDTHQYVRNAQKKDQIDIISRELILSTNTGRYCVHMGGWSYVPAAQIEAERPGYNPVRVCCSPYSGCSNGLSDCFSGSNLTSTCMEVGDPTANPVIYPRIFIRSTIEDLRGRKWITDVQNDPYINLNWN